MIPSLRRYQRSIQTRCRQLLNPWLLRANCPELPLSEAVIIAGSNRSGTTWLQEVAAELPGSVTIFEPLHVDVVQPARRAGFHKLSAFTPGESRPAAKEYLQRVLTGREWHWYTTQLNPLSACRRPRQLIVKFIHANGILEWLTHELPVRRPVVVIRHPAAVNSSIFHRGWNLSRVREELLRSELAERSAPLRRYLAALTTPEEQLTARWCLENAVLFKAARPWKFELISYESLVLGGPAALQRLFDVWQLPAPASVQAAYSRASSMSSLNREYTDAEQRLAKWRTELRPLQVQTILRVTREFGLDFYSEELLPYVHRLARCTADGLLNSVEPLRTAA
jgi:hypothetical protein